MNDLDFKENFEPARTGKGFIIAVVVIFSSLSFILGYYVGKNTNVPVQDTARPVETPPVTAVPEPIKPQTQLPVDKPADNAVAAQGQKSGEPRPPEQPALPAPAEKQAVETNPRPDKNRKPAEPAEVVTESTINTDTLYTVQTGALKSRPEAEKIKKRLEKKGYKARIVTVKDEKKVKIYKIRVGSFKNRKDAEILSLKIKKNEGLQAFVTPKDE